jgi:hypothetical protein
MLIDAGWKLNEGAGHGSHASGRLFVIALVML